MELLFSRDDEIRYGKECDNKNWATENHEYASHSFCNSGGIKADKNHVGEKKGGRGGRQMERNKLIKVPTCNPKNSSTA